MDFQFFEPWHDVLPREGGHVLVCVGGGGKTTLLGLCADMLAAEGVAVALTSTAAPTVPDGRDMCVWEPGTPPPEGVRFVVGPGPRALTGAEVDALSIAWSDHVLLVEADASAGLPVALPGEGRPVWPSRTSLAVIVGGVAAVGSQAGQVVAGFDPSRPLLEGLAPWSTWEWDHSLRVITGPGGYVDQVPDDVPVLLALIGLDEQPDTIGLFDFVGRAMADPRLPIVLFGDLRSDPVSMRAVYRQEEDEPPRELPI